MCVCAHTCMRAGMHVFGVKCAIGEVAISSGRSHLLDQATQVMWDGIIWFLHHLEH